MRMGPNPLQLLDVSNVEWAYSTTWPNNTYFNCHPNYLNLSGYPITFFYVNE